MVVALAAVERRLDRAVEDAVDGDAVGQRVERLLGDLAVGAHAVAPEPAGRRQFEQARQAAVVGQEQQALGVDVEAADGDDARHLRRQRGEYGRPALRVARGGDQPFRLVIEPQPRALARRQRDAVDGDAVRRADIDGGRGQHAAVDGDAAVGDPAFGVAARAEAGAGDHLGDPLAGRRVVGLAGCVHGAGD